MWWCTWTRGQRWRAPCWKGHRSGAQATPTPGRLCPAFEVLMIAVEGSSQAPARCEWKAKQELQEPWSTWRVRLSFFNTLCASLISLSPLSYRFPPTLLTSLALNNVWGNLQGGEVSDAGGGLLQQICFSSTFSSWLDNHLPKSWDMLWKIQMFNDWKLQRQLHFI